MVGRQQIMMIGFSKICEIWVVGGGHDDDPSRPRPRGWVRAHGVGAARAQGQGLPSPLPPAPKAAVAAHAVAVRAELERIVDPTTAAREAEQRQTHILWGAR